MDTISFTNSKYEKLKRFNPGNGIVNVESELFIIGARNKEDRKLLKKFYQKDSQIKNSLFQ